MVLVQQAAIEVARRQGYMGRRVSGFDANRKQTMRMDGTVFTSSQSFRICFNNTVRCRVASFDKLEL